MSKSESRVQWSRGRGRGMQLVDMYRIEMKQENKMLYNLLIVFSETCGA